MREQVGANCLYNLKGWPFSFLLGLVAQMSQVSDLALCIARHIDQTIESLACAQASEHVSVKTASRWVNDADNLLYVVTHSLLVDDRW